MTTQALATQALKTQAVTAQFLTAALYKFVALPDCAALRQPLQDLCDSLGVRGTLLLATEGINGTISGPAAAVKTVLQHLRADPRLADLVHKESWAAKLPFLRMKVRVKKEIVTLGLPGISPTLMAGQYVKPEQWNALISDPTVVVIDTRNDYEVSLGTFKGAVDPAIQTFADLPNWVAAQEMPQGVLAGRGAGQGAGLRKPKVAMFCTGGIRCEKSTALLRQKGYDEVYHLEGGILKYLEQVPPAQSLWQGECFVFDERVSVGHGLTQGHYELCRSCRHPVGDSERASAQFERGVSCPRCLGLRNDDEKRAFKERQRQVDLARARGLAHVGAKPPPKLQKTPRKLADPVRHLLNLLHAEPSLQVEPATTDGVHPTHQKPSPRRIVIALAGLPGSGKSTVAAQWVQALNTALGQEVAVALSMDGFHLTKAQLTAAAQLANTDPAEAFKRRGAPWTFDPQALAARLALLRKTEQGKPVLLAWPGFEHGVGDPVADTISIPPQIQVVIVEGLYLLHPDHGWHVVSQSSGLIDEFWYLDVPMKLAMQRLVARHMQSNGNTLEQAHRRLSQNDRLNAQLVLASRANALWRVGFLGHQFV